MHFLSTKHRSLANNSSVSLWYQGLYVQGGGITKLSLMTRIDTRHCSIMHNKASQHCGELSLLKSVKKGCKE